MPRAPDSANTGLDAATVQTLIDAGPAEMIQLGINMARAGNPALIEHILAYGVKPDGNGHPRVAFHRLDTLDAIVRACAVSDEHADAASHWWDLAPLSLEMEQRAHLRLGTKPSSKFPDPRNPTACLVAALKDGYHDAAVLMVRRGADLHSPAVLKTRLTRPAFGRTGSIVNYSRVVDVATPLAFAMYHRAAPAAELTGLLLSAAQTKRGGLLDHVPFGLRLDDDAGEQNVLTVAGPLHHGALITEALLRHMDARAPAVRNAISETLQTFRDMVSGVKRTLNEDEPVVGAVGALLAHPGAPVVTEDYLTAFNIKIGERMCNLLHGLATTEHDRIAAASLRALHRRGINIAAPDSNGWTVLHYAARRGSNHLVQTLLECGLDPNAETDDHRDAFACAERFPETQVFMRSWSARAILRDATTASLRP